MENSKEGKSLEKEKQKEKRKEGAHQRGAEATAQKKQKREMSEESAATAVEWEMQQKRTFTNWVNERLKKQSLVPGLPELHDVTTELEDGVHLVCLMHALFPQAPATLRQFKTKPRNSFEKKLNIEYALQLADQAGVRAPLTKVSHFVEVRHRIKSNAGNTATTTAPQQQRQHNKWSGCPTA